MAEQKVPRRLHVESDRISVVNLDEVSRILQDLSRGPAEARWEFSLHIKIGSGREVLTRQELDTIRRLRELPLSDLYEGID
jgi:hypothetical protein